MATILIVEDNPSVAKFYALALERRGGMKCLIAQTAEDVLGSAQGGQIALVLLDVSLANFTYQGQAIDGLQLSRMLKEDPKTRHLPILLATAHAMVGDRERFLAVSQADDYLQKPIYDSKILVQKVEELLAKCPG